jgi:ABC-2 type transport system ATP-binding protein
MLSVESIYKSFYRKIALEDVSLSIKEGEIYGLLGPNGAGKTTLIRIINFIVQQDRGIVRFKGDLMTEKHLQQVGYLPEERGLYRAMTVYDHALFLGRLRGLTKRDVLQNLNYWLEKFNIEDWKEKRIENLSKGMAQKVQFICAVLHQPQLLILDEPFSGFDPINIEMIQQELIEMKANGKTILLSSHNMKSVEEICDRVALIHNSKKILEGTVTEIRDSRKDGMYAVKFRGNMISFVTALWSSFELVDKEILSDNRFVAYVRMRNESTFQDLLKTLLGNVEIEAAWEVLPSMQEVFIQEVNKETPLV